jgi:hypothetical protein
MEAVMSSRAERLIVWSPRIVGILVALFIGIFAFDAIQEGLLAFLLHLTPMFVLLAVVTLSWRWPWVGAGVFTGLAILYATTSPRLDWILYISGPLVVVGLLFFLSWRFRARRA